MFAMKEFWDCLLNTEDNAFMLAYYPYYLPKRGCCHILKKCKEQSACISTVTSVTIEYVIVRNGLWEKVLQIQCLYVLIVIWIRFEAWQSRKDNLLLYYRRFLLKATAPWYNAGKNGWLRMTSFWIVWMPSNSPLNACVYISMHD